MRGLMALLPQLQSSTWPPRAENTIRVATYNIRVDHDADDGTGHEWAHRRPLAARAIADLDCDIVLLSDCVCHDEHSVFRPILKSLRDVSSASTSKPYVQLR